MPSLARYPLPPAAERGFPCEDRLIAQMLIDAGRRIEKQLHEQSRDDGLPLVVGRNGDTLLLYPEGAVQPLRDIDNPKPPGPALPAPS